MQSFCSCFTKFKVSPRRRRIRVERSEAAFTAKTCSFASSRLRGKVFHQRAERWAWLAVGIYVGVRNCRGGSPSRRNVHGSRAARSARSARSASALGRHADARIGRGSGSSAFPTRVFTVKVFGQSAPRSGFADQEGPAEMPKEPEVDQSLVILVRSLDPDERLRVDQVPRFQIALVAHDSGGEREEAGVGRPART
jgi:hypothetical protein